MCLFIEKYGHLHTSLQVIQVHAFQHAKNMDEDDGPCKLVPIHSPPLIWTLHV